MPLFRAWHEATEAHDNGALPIEAKDARAAAKQWSKDHGQAHPEGTVVVEAPGGQCSAWRHAPKPAKSASPAPVVAASDDLDVEIVVDGAEKLEE